VAHSLQTAEKSGGGGSDPIFGKNIPRQDIPIPGKDSYGADDRENAEALGHARREGGFGMYVHPVRPRDPFPKEASPDGIPLGELLTTITASSGIWANHSAAPPAWVAVDSDDPGFKSALEVVLSQHYGGCDIREPDPNHQPSSSVVGEVG
jgi:hypothetical protein